MKIDIVYDGECPFCSDFVKISNLWKKFPNLRLCSAREGTHPSVKLVIDKGYDLDDGMAVVLDDAILYSIEAARFISKHSQPNTLRMWGYRGLLMSPKFGALIYGFLVHLRRLYFRLRGKKLINE